MFGFSPSLIFRGVYAIYFWLIIPLCVGLVLLDLCLCLGALVGGCLCRLPLWVMSYRVSLGASVITAFFPATLWSLAFMVIARSSISFLLPLCDVPALDDCLVSHLLCCLWIPCVIHNGLSLFPGVIPVWLCQLGFLLSQVSLTFQSFCSSRRCRACLRGVFPPLFYAVLLQFGLF